MSVADDLLTGLVAAGITLRGEDGASIKGDRGPKGLKGDKGDDGAAGPDEKVKIDSDDPRAGFLADKLEAGRGIYIRKTEAGSKLVIDAATSFMGVGAAAPGGGSSGGGAPSGPAGGDLSGTYPNPSVVNDSHSHGPGTAPGSGTGFDYVQEADPGAVGAGKFWLFAGTFGYPDTYQLRRRNAGNTAWLPVTAIYTETSEGTYINSPDNGSFLQLGLSGQFTELGNSDGTNLFLDQGGIFHGSPNGEGWYHGSVDPSAGAGVVAVRGSFYQLNDGASAGSLWVKSGNADTAWTKLGAGLAGSAQTYTESNVTTDRALNANSTTLDEIADVLGTLIVDLRNRGVVA